MYRNSLIAKTIFEDFVVFCCIFLTKYAEFHISLILKSAYHMNSTTFGQWALQSIAIIFDKS